MKKNFKNSMFIFILLALGLNLLACGSKKEKALAIQYGSGETANIEYNNELYYRNDPKVNTADPFVIWVSEEDDSVNGGYYYMYGSAAEKYGFTQNGVYDPNACCAFNCYKSKDLTNWEECGKVNGYALVSDADDWTYKNFWAPEVIFDKTSKTYYMYYSADRFKAEYGTQRDARAMKVYSGSNDACLAVAKSDSPMGPFKLIRDGKDFDNNDIGNACLFDIAKNFEYNGPWSAIDASIFRSSNGKLYLYFTKPVEDGQGYSNGVWGMELKDYVTADFSTLRCLTVPGYSSVNFEKGKLAKTNEAVSLQEGSAELKATDITRNEAPFMYEHNGKFYLTFCPNGFKSAAYCVMQAISDDPLGVFVKPDIDKGNPLVSTAASQMSYISGTGHHCLIKTTDGDLYTVYARAGNPVSFDDAGMHYVGVDKCGFTTFGDGTEEVMYCNGPTIALQPLSESFSGYKNVASDATISASNGEGSELLNDGKINAMSSLKNVEFTSSGAVTITLELKEAVNIKSIMVYNSSNYDTAFKSIDLIKMYYSEKNDYDCAIIQDLCFPNKYVDIKNRTMVLGAAAVADFNDIMVNKIEITISQKFVEKDRLGNDVNSINLAEIVVLGK